MFALLYILTRNQCWMLNCSTPFKGGCSLENLHFNFKCDYNKLLISQLRMNTKTFTTGLLSAVIASSVLFTTSASAFWPFDALFNKGEVKAAVSDKVYRPESDDRANKLATTLKTMSAICDEMYSTAPIRKPQPGEVDPATGKVVAAQNGNTGVVSPKRTSVEQNEGNDNFRESGSAGNNNRILPSMGKPAPMSKELEAINSALRDRCTNIKNINQRLLKIYTPPTSTPTSVVTGTSCGGLRGVACPAGYTCTYKEKKNILGRVTPDSTGTCVPSNKNLEYKIN